MDRSVIRGTVTIPSGSTVRIADHAQLTAAKGSRVVVLGTLLAPQGAAITGTGWSGITVGSGGTASLSYLQLRGAGIATQTGATSVSLANARIAGAATPFEVAEGSRLSLSRVQVDDVQGASVVKGTLVADFLSYDKGGDTGIVQTGPASVMRLTRSSFTGNGRFEGDMLTTSDAGELTVSDSTLADNHCAFHLVGVRALTLTRLEVHDNAYGFMAYGSDTGATHRITDTDVFDNRDYGLFERPSTVQGKVLVDGGFWGRNGDQRDLVQITGKFLRTHPASAPRH